jgi:hypothetical protein
LRGNALGRKSVGCGAAASEVAIDELQTVTGTIRARQLYGGAGELRSPSADGWRSIGAPHE